ncbi:MAG: PDZ domain-containing protein [Arhodomonas sp.]|nr:PDZ domain-containing protein [Arhodomonas sp.]
MKHASIIAALLGLLAAASLSAAPLPQPTSLQQGEARLVAELLSQYHFREQAIDDDLSEEVYRAYFDALDPQRYYFLAKDVEAFADYRRTFDDRIRDGDLAPAWAVFDRYYQRVQERVDFALSLIEKGASLREGSGEFRIDREDAEWAESRAELDALWRKRVRHDALTLRMNDTPWEDVRKTLRERYERLSRSIGQYKPEDIFQAFMNAWSSRYDPHTSYLSPRRSENFDINMSLSLEGIGALLKGEGAYTEIVELIPGGPAAGSGDLSPGDRIIGVAQGDEEMVDVVRVAAVRRGGSHPRAAGIGGALTGAPGRRRWQCLPRGGTADPQPHRARGTGSERPGADHGYRSRWASCGRDRRTRVLHGL